MAACSDATQQGSQPDASNASEIGPQIRSLSPGARPEVAQQLRDSLERPHHESDGGGRAWLESSGDDPAFAIAGTPGRFTLVYEVGPHGVASGGSISFQVSPFWGWSTPQVEIADAPGYTRVEPSADDIDLEIATLDQQLLGIRVVGRALVAGERIRCVFGAGPAGAIADRYAEKKSRFWFAVDGDGDGTRKFLVDSPGVDVHPRTPSQLRITLPSVVRPGQEVRVTIAVLDGRGNAGFPFEGEIAFVGDPPGLGLPERVAMRATQRGRMTIGATAAEPGVIRLHAETDTGLAASSNPMLIATDAPIVFWGDLHGHSSLSDGTGSVIDYFEYARDVAALDVVALTDHDHWGLLPLATHPEMWDEIQQQTRRFHDPGRFVTLLGFEWTSWLHGHRHVLYFSDEGDVYDSVDPRFESPTQLWDALRGRPALTFAHHSAGGPIATNWDFPPDPVLEPLTEIASVHGSSESADTPIPIYQPVQGNYVRDALDRGYRFGFVGSGDSHDGHPGLAQLASASGGLAAILAGDLSRESVLAALRERRVYATNGPRIVLRTALDQHRMGALIPKPGPDGYSGELFVSVLAVAPLSRVDLIRSGAVIDSIETEDSPSVNLHRRVEGLQSGEYLYVRAVQIDDGTAWSSPIFVQ